MQRFTLEEMANHLRYKTTKAFSSEVKRLGIPYIPLGRRMIFDPVAVEAFLIAQRPAAKQNVVRLPVRREKNKGGGRLAERLNLV